MTLPTTESLLHRLGWDDGWEAAFAEHRAAGLAPARVAIQHRGAYDLLAEAGELRVSAATRLVKQDELPAVGDWVGVRSRHAARRSRPRTAHGDLPQRGLAGRAGAGPRRERRRRVPRPGAAARLQRAAARAVPRDGVGERRAAGRPAHESRPRRRRDAVPRRGGDRDARRVSRSRRVGADRRRARGAPHVARAEPHGRVARLVGRRQVDDRERPRRARSCSRRRRCGPTITAAVTRRRIAS